MQLNFLIFITVLAFQSTVSDAKPFVRELSNHAPPILGTTAALILGGRTIQKEVKTGRRVDNENRGNGKLVYRSGLTKKTKALRFLDIELDDSSYSLDPQLGRYLDTLSRADDKTKLKAVGGKSEHLPVLESVLDKLKARIGSRV